MLYGANLALEFGIGSNFQIRIKRLDPLRSKKIFIRKAEDGPYLGFGYKSLISDPIRSVKRSRRKIVIL